MDHWTSFKFVHRMQGRRERASEGAEMPSEDREGVQWKCRLWWPQHFTFVRPAVPMSLIGWASLSASCCLDLVVATACPVESSSPQVVFVCLFLLVCAVGLLIKSPSLNIFFQELSFPVNPSTNFLKESSVGVSFYHLGLWFFKAWAYFLVSVPCFMYMSKIWNL